MNKQMMVLALSLAVSPWIVGGVSAATMDHSKMTMDCSDPMHAQMDACKAQATKPVDHSKMDHSKMEGMDHSKMNMPAATPTQPAMDHSKMQGMDHSKMNMPAAKPMDHSKMGGMAGMDHSKMDMTASGPKIPVSDGSVDEYIPTPFPGAMHMVDDPLLTKIMIDRFEIINSDENDKPILLEADAWIGKDLNKLWLKTEIERVGSETEEAEVQLLYSRAISAYWDIQAGFRKDFKPEQREWAAFSLKGLAPYYFDVDASFFVGEGGRTAARVSGEYELMLSQKTALIPEVEFNLYGQDDPAMGVGSGLSDANVSLRIQHEFSRQFAPYIGVSWNKLFGDTADLAREDGEDTSDAQIMVGVHAWF